MIRPFLSYSSIALVCFTSVWAQESKTNAPKQSPPPPGPIRPFTFPKPAVKTLSNGLAIYVIEDHRQPLVSYALVMDAGGIRNSPEKTGLAAMTASLLRQGTTTRSAQEIAQLVDNTGGNLNASADDDIARVQGSFVKSSADLGLELLADITLHPAFKQEELDRLRRQTLSGLQVEYTDPSYLAPLAAARTIYGEHPYGLPNDGTPETLQALTRDEVARFHQQYYTPQGAILAFVGDVQPAQAFAQAEKLFGSWKGTAAAASKVQAPPAPARRIVVIDKPDAVQTQIFVGTLGIPRNDPDYIPLLIANQVFGGDFNSRLNMKLRANEGLTYGASSRFEAERVAGLFQATTFTRTEKTATAIRFLLDLLKEFHDNPSSAAELDEAKQVLAGSFVVNSETPAQVAARILTVAINKLPADYWDHYREAIMAVTPQQLAAAVQRRIDSNTVTIVAVGNAKAFAKDLEGFGTVRTIALGDFDPIRPDLVRVKAAGASANGAAVVEGGGKQHP